MPDTPTPPDPTRFEVKRATLWLDTFMGWLIRFGGVAVIVAVFGIFYFIGKEVVPLFRGAQVEKISEFQGLVGAPVMGVDEWGKLPFFYDGGDKVVFVEADGSRRTELPVPGLEGAAITAMSYDPLGGRVSLGTQDGRVGSFLVKYTRHVSESGEGQVEPEIVAEPWFSLSHGAGPLVAVSYGAADSARVLVARRGEPGAETVSILRLGMKRSLMGKGALSLLEEKDVTAELPGACVMARASQSGQVVLVACADGHIVYFRSDADGISKRQMFDPFGGVVSSDVEFLFGGVSAIVSAADGRQEQWSLFRKGGEGERLFGKTKEFPKLAKGHQVFAASQRNRSFLTGAGGGLSLRHSTSGSVRWSGNTGSPPVAAVMDGKGEHFLVLDAQGRGERYAIHDPHPEAGWRAFFGKVWYEGGDKPVYQWQSTGGSDDFEPKLSLVPLIFGSLKGTLYALLFAVPVALLAALFSAAFLPLSVKKFLKPAMEIMSSLPSVVLGFLAGLWLAPLLVDRVPSVLLLVVFLPLSALLAGFLWCRLPIGFRNRFEGGSEWMLVLPVLAAAAWLGWVLGPWLESWAFVYKDPHTGARLADFRMWWPQALGIPYEQRNSLVLGFIMGFAVIPVIFTIAEDALSNVPKSLTAAAAALGANRWQVVRTVMLPVASSGIFSALMIGFGRAVGETMVMVMATGNTPVMSWNLFNGMRTLSANIAVELPEAPVGSTHYRALFLGAVVLFAMTFVLNTIAEVLRQRLRERNKLV